jgi:hypothetical protein
MKGMDLGMGAACRLVETFTNNRTILDNDRPYHRVGRGPTPTLFSQLKGHFHKRFVHD